MQNYEVSMRVLLLLNSRISPTTPIKAFPVWVLSPINRFLCFMILQCWVWAMIEYQASSTTSTWTQISRFKGHSHICGRLAGTIKENGIFCYPRNELNRNLSVLGSPSNFPALVANTCLCASPNPPFAFHGFVHQHLENCQGWRSPSLLMGPGLQHPLGEGVPHLQPEPASLWPCPLLVSSAAAIPPPSSI